MIQSSYLKNILDIQSRKDVIKKAVADLKKIREKFPFEAIAFRGMSGALIAPEVATKLQCKLLLVRKPGEKSHTSYHTEGDLDFKTYIILDDFVDSGQTVKAILNALHGYKCLGIYCWAPECGANYETIKMRTNIKKLNRFA